MSGDAPTSNSTPPLESWFTPRRFALGLALALGVGFFPVLTGARSFYFFDYGVLGYPFAHFHREQFWSGNFFPLWNPLSNCGAPFLAQWGTMTLYPGSLIYLLFPLPWSLGVFCLAHLFLGGLGMYRLARAWWDDDFAAAVAGTAYTFSGIVLAALVWPNYCVALGWMPFVVWLAERAARDGGPARLAWAALAGAMQMMAGVPELVVFTWLLIGLLWLRGLVRRELAPLPSLGKLTAVVALIAGLSLAQLLPFFELLNASQRHAGFTTERWSLPLWGVGNFIAPLFHHFQNFQGMLLQNDQTFLQSCYPGILVVLLALVGVALDRTRRSWWLAAALVVSVVFAWGSRGIVFAWVRNAFPLVSIARFPVKFLFLAAFLFPLLAAGAITNLQRTDKPLGYRLTLGAGAFLLAALGILAWINFRWPFQYDLPAPNALNVAWRAGFLAAGLAVLWQFTRTTDPRRAGGLGVALLALVWADALMHKPGLNPTLPAAVFQPGIVEIKPPELGDGRVMISRAAEEALVRSTVREPDRDFLGKRFALWSNLNLLEGAPKVNGSSTLQLRWQKEVQDVLYSTNAPDLASLIDFLGVSQVTSPTNVVEWVPRSGAMPLVTIGQKPVPVDALKSIPEFSTGIFNAREMAYVAVPDASGLKAERNPNARVVKQAVSPNRIDAEITTDRPALVVIAQSFHHPWTAYVDGSSTPLLRANHAFQAVEVPAGARHVSVVYEDRAFRAGAAASLASLLACGLLIWRGRRPVTASP